jgi:hypothetical protein
MWNIAVFLVRGKGTLLGSSCTSKGYGFELFVSGQPLHDRIGWSGLLPYIQIPIRCVMERHEGIVSGLRIASVLNGNADYRLGEEDQLTFLELVLHHLLEGGVLGSCQDSLRLD